MTCIPVRGAAARAGDRISAVPEGAVGRGAVSSLALLLPPVDGVGGLVAADCTGVHRAA